MYNSTYILKLFKMDNYKKLILHCVRKIYNSFGLHKV